ncbi:ABC transporter permease subunit [Nocardia jinanensis]|uniref:ABC transporter permease n=1 Tax=Nocardia jinanensis TaxID=382504 RepID=A0A917RL46_9NOCA|nr:ABC transporter permease subunit [Nocardia jinanensis]GGL12103.1 ABC transporter permease [Nocardia jinanensis]
MKTPTLSRPAGSRRLGLTALPAVAVVALAVAGPLFAPYAVDHPVGITFENPNGKAWLGGDRLGHDVLSQLLHGGWGLLLVAATIALLVTTIAAVLGSVAALYPRAGAWIERTADLGMLLPPVLAILLFMLSWPESGAVGLVVISVASGTPYTARVFAAAASGVAASGFIEAARGRGEGMGYLVSRELLPNLRETLLTQLGLRFVEAMYLVSTAAFLQLPTTLGDANWAVMVRENASGILLNPAAVLAPSLAIGLLAVSVNSAVAIFGRGRRDI